MSVFNHHHTSGFRLVFFALILICCIFGLLVVWIDLPLWFNIHQIRPKSSELALPLEYIPLIQSGLETVKDGVNRQEYAMALMNRLTSPRASRPAQQHTHSVLCTTFLSWKSTNLEKLAKSITDLGQNCHWLVLVYNSHGKTVNEMNAELVTSLRISSLFQNLSQLELFVKADNTLQESITIRLPPGRVNDVLGYKDLCNHRVLELNHKLGADWTAGLQSHPCSFLESSSNNSVNLKTYPKVAMMVTLLDYVDRYRYVWVLDGDLQFDGFDFLEFFRIHQCAFDHAPLIAQPLIYEDKDSYHFLSRTYWRGSKVLATKLSFLEIQLPFLETQFLDWFILAVIVPLFQPMYITGGDWGFDELFCKAAAIYGIAVSANSQGISSAALTTSPQELVQSQCGLIVATAVHHSDSNEIRDLIGNNRVKVAINQVMRDLVQEHYPMFYYPGRIVKKQMSASRSKVQSFRSIGKNPTVQVVKALNSSCASGIIVA
jgi:hypothetical protein